METLNKFIRLAKVDAATRTVWGIATAEVVDKANEIMDYDTTKPFYEEWSGECKKNSDGKSLGNVRAMHGKVAAGKIIAIDYDDVNKAIRIGAEIVDDQEWAKVEKGVYTGFSQGGGYVKRWPDPTNPAVKRYTAAPIEVSIVDNPCVGIATFEYAKADGQVEMRKFAAFEHADEVGVGIVQGWQAQDGTFFAKKTDAVQHNIETIVTKASETATGALDVLQKARDALGTGAADSAAAPANDVVVEKTAEEKAAAFQAAVHKAVLAKQLCDIPQLVDVIYSLSWLQDALEWDTLFDDANTSTLPADLKAILASLCAFLKAMVDDAVKDMTDDAEKALTFEQAEALRKFTGNADLLPGITAPVVVEPVEKVADPAHAEALAAVNSELAAEKAARSDLESTVGQLQAGLEEVTKGITALKDGSAAEKAALEKRIKELEAQPMPSKGFVGTGVAVNKGHEGQEAGSVTAPVEASTKNFRGLSPAEAVAKANAKTAAQ